MRLISFFKGYNWKGIRFTTIWSSWSACRKKENRLPYLINLLDFWYKCETQLVVLENNAYGIITVLYILTFNGVISWIYNYFKVQNFFIVLDFRSYTPAVYNIIYNIKQECIRRGIRLSCNKFRIHSRFILSDLFCVLMMAGMYASLVAVWFLFPLFYWQKIYFFSNGSRWKYWAGYVIFSVCL